VLQGDEALVRRRSRARLSQVASEDGNVFIVKAGPEYLELGKRSMNEVVMATPAFRRRPRDSHARSSLRHRRR
jgi:hypothetical protein